MVYKKKLFYYIVCYIQKYSIDDVVCFVSTCLINSLVSYIERSYFEKSAINIVTCIESKPIDAVFQLRQKLSR